MNPSVAAPARYLYSMAKDGILPSALGKLHPKYKSPYIAILFMGIIIVLLISTNSIIFIASLSLFADLFYYIIGLISAAVLRVRFPDMTRPFKAPFAFAGAVISSVIYLVLISQLEREAFISGAVWCVIGALIFLVRKPERRMLAEHEHIEEPLSEAMKAKLAREFKIWAVIVFGLFAGLITLFIASYLI